MAVYELSVSLSISGNKKYSVQDFMTSLNAKIDGVVIGKQMSGPGQIQGHFLFFNAPAHEFYKEGKEDELFEKLTPQLERVAAWMNEKRLAIKNRDDSINLMMSIEFFSEDSDIELVLPPVFLIACGEADVPILIVSNE